MDQWLSCKSTPHFRFCTIIDEFSDILQVFGSTNSATVIIHCIRNVESGLVYKQNVIDFSVCPKTDSHLQEIVSMLCVILLQCLENVNFQICRCLFEKFNILVAFRKSGLRVFILDVHWTHFNVYFQCEPTLLPEPNHVMLNHLYALSIKDGVMVLSATHRYRKKYVTTLLYKPI